MYRTSPLSRRISTAAICAGPIFVGMMVAAMLYAQLPKPIAISLNFADLLGLPLMLPLTAGVGFGLALLPVTLGTLFMTWCGARWQPMRRAPAWIVAGATGPVLLSILCGWPGELGLALGATGACCAALARPADAG